jgi:hypothetical protein
MTKWEYKTVVVERTGSKEDFSFNWIYGPWETKIGEVKSPLLTSLGDLGKDGWELSGVMPTDLWNETGRGGSPARVRSIACLLLFKRPLP